MANLDLISRWSHALFIMVPK